MPPKESDPRYVTVTEEKDGSLVCACKEFDQTGKACVHIKVARLQMAYGSVMNYVGMSNYLNKKNDFTNRS